MKRNCNWLKTAKKGERYLICPTNCLFYCQYQLSYKYLWHYCITTLPFSTIDWTCWVVLFEDGNFEIYEFITKTYVENEIYNIIERFD